MSQPKVSIIVPIYNAEFFLPKMLKSIRVQTMPNFEVLLIDDGSTDGSAAICDRICAEDDRFKVIHKLNGGVSAARQTGIEMAQGTYVIHADADDWMDDNMLLNLCYEADMRSADIVIADYYVNIGQRQDTIKQQPSSSEPNVILSELFKHLHGALWNKLVRRSCYTKYGAQFFPGINYCEDVLFWVQILQHNDIKVFYHSMAYYHYVVNDNSITRHYTEKTYKTCQLYNKKLKEILTNSDFGICVRKAQLMTLFNAFTSRVINDKEIRRQLLADNKRAAFVEERILRYKAGYMTLALGMYSLAHKLLIIKD